MEADKANIKASLEQSLKKLNDTLANFQRVSTIIIDQTTRNEENGLLTPTLKVRRGALNDTYGSSYESWHEQKEKVLWI